MRREVAAETTRTSGVEDGVADAAPESIAEKPMMPEEQMACPKASKGMVGRDVRPWSPLVVPPSIEEEDMVEEIECEES